MEPTKEARSSVLPLTGPPTRARIPPELHRPLLSLGPGGGGVGWGGRVVSAGGGVAFRSMGRAGGTEISLLLSVSLHHLAEGEEPCGRTWRRHLQSTRRTQSRTGQVVLSRASSKYFHFAGHTASITNMQLCLRGTRQPRRQAWG